MALLPEETCSGAERFGSGERRTNGWDWVRVALIAVVLGIASGCGEQTEVCNGLDLFCNRKASAKLEALPSSVGHQGDVIVFDASDSIFDELNWSLNGDPIYACNDEDQCELTFPTPGRFTVTIVAEVTGYGFQPDTKDDAKQIVTIHEIDEGPEDQVVLFLTSQSYSGNLGGRTGADLKCADNQPTGLSCSGVAAMLSVGSGDQLAQLPTLKGFSSTIPIVGEFAGNPKLADSWVELFSGTLLRTPQATTGAESYWTGSMGDGTVTADNCSGWTSTVSVSGTEGDGTAADGTWLDIGVLACNNSLPLLCVCY